MATERKIPWVVPVKVAAWLLLCLLAIAAGRGFHEGNYGQMALPRDWPVGVSASPGGGWGVRAYAYSDGEFTWAEVRAKGSTHWRRIYDGPDASVSWANANTVVFTDYRFSNKHPVDVRTGDYGVTPHGAFGEVFAWAQIAGVSLVVLVIGAAIIIFAPRITARARLARARRRGETG